jgi:hypothetical protein
MFPQINWSNLADINYWLEGSQTAQGSIYVTPPIARDSWFFWFFLSLFTSLIILGIGIQILNILTNHLHPIKEKYPIWSANLIWMGILGYIWFLSRQFGISFFSSRLWLIGGGIWFAVLSFFIFRYFIKFFPLENMYYKKQIVDQKIVS